MSLLRRKVRIRWTRGASIIWFLVVFDAEEDVEEVCGNQDKVETKDGRPASLCRRRGGLLASRVILKGERGLLEDSQYLGFHVSRNLHPCCSPTKAECIENNQPCVVCLGKVTQILQLGKSRPRQRVGSDEIRGKMLNLELRICLFVSVVCFLLPKTTWLFSPQWW